MTYKEIEFVCVNSQSVTATPLEKQEELYAALQELQGVFTYRQDFTDEEGVQVMMASVILDPEKEQVVLEIARAHGVRVDLVGETEYTPAEFARLKREVTDGSIPFYMPPPPAKPSIVPHPRPNRTINPI